MKIRTLSGTILATVIALHAFGASGTNVFPAARGVLQRFAGEDVAEKFVFMRIEADEPQAEVSAHDGKILIRATDENRAAAAVGRYIREVAKGHWSRCGNRVPTEWPLPKEPLKVKAALPVRCCPIVHKVMPNRLSFRW